VAGLFSKFFFTIDYEVKMKQIRKENQVSDGKLAKIISESLRVKENHKKPNQLFIKLAQILK
jgi:hypothetical protein